MKLSAYLKKPKVSGETFEEFVNLPKGEQTQKKDVGAYLAGISKGNARKKAEIEAVSAIILDVDDADVNTLEKVRATAKYYILVHSTRKHSPEKPRYRVIVPLAKLIPVVQREAVARKIAQDLGVLDECDPASFRDAQVMFFPSICKDSPYVFYEGHIDTLLDANSILNSYNDWQNMLEWPYTTKEKEEHKKAISRSRSVNVQYNDGNKNGSVDPRTKTGYVGAFCKVFMISKAIETFLKNVYTYGTKDDRYTLIGASTEDGLWVKDDLWAYSFHASDPVCRQYVNAYDLVRIHLFGNLDDDVTEGTPFSRFPSVLAMNKMIADIPDIKVDLFFQKHELDEEEQDKLIEKFFQNMEGG